MKQAEEFLVAAKENMNESRYNVAGFTAVQAMINSNDALTIYYLEKREFSKPVMLEMNLPQAIQSLNWIKQNCQEINITL